MQNLQAFSIGEEDVNIVEDIAFCWEKVAIQLDFSTAYIRKLQKNHATTDDPTGNSCFVMLQDWLERDSNATWRLLIGAIKCDSQLAVLANDIEHALN